MRYDLGMDIKMPSAFFVAGWRLPRPIFVCVSILFHPDS